MMVSVFGIVSFVVFALCCVGLVLHYRLMKKRIRLDNAEYTKQISEGDTETETKETEYETALADYAACVSRFPYNVIAKILNLPHERSE
jgi:Ca2+/Na+ antiporter